MNKLAAYLQKKAAELNPNDMEGGFRLNFRPAQLAALQGLSPEQQSQANWDALKLRAGTGVGALGLGALGSLIGGAVAGDDSKLLGKFAGGAIGGLLGLPLGSYITNKIMQSNRGLGDETGPGLANWFGLKAPVAALGLAGLTKEQQEKANSDYWKLFAGSAAGSYMGDSDKLGGSTLGSFIGGRAAFEKLKNDALQKQMYEQLNNLKSKG